MQKQQNVLLIIAMMKLLQTSQIDEFFRRLAAERPNPETELNYVNAFTLLVAVVLSAQATDVGVNKATKSLFEKITTPQQMTKLGEEGLKKYIKTIGLFNAKAKNVIALSERLVKDFGGEVPKTRAELESLPGVGQKTASVILNVLYGENTIAVDTHVFRVSNRTGLAHAKTPHEMEAKLLKAVPAKWLRHAHHWLILHGRYTCKARAPQCPTCIVRDICLFKDKAGSL